MVRPFIAWDGEGTKSDGPQPYVLFGNSLGLHVQARQLKTLDMLKLLLQTGSENPYAVHVGYATDYDVNQILCDIRPHDVLRLRRSGKKRISLDDDWGFKWKFSLEYRPKKYFKVSGNWKGQYVTVWLYDIFTFFGTSFLKALDDFVGQVADVKEIQEGKGNRENFTYDDIAIIKSYWEKELIWLVKLAENLRENLQLAGFELTKWHGPGALSNMLFTREGISKHMARVEISPKEAKRGITGLLPKEVNDAAQHAFFGGRFEMFKVGNYEGDVWNFDINSAYPYAISQLPSLASGWWEYVENPDHIEEFGVYHIAGSDPHASIRSGPMRLPYRTHDGTIGYPRRVDGWYWSPETKLVHGSKGYHVLEGWVFHSDGTKPFDWVRDMYEQRLEWKKAGNPLQLALKLALNSLYGKMAQRVGWERDEGFNIPPRFHQLEWAGWVTSFTRAQIYRGMAEVFKANKRNEGEAGHVLFGVETDGFTTDWNGKDDGGNWILNVGERLGQWDATQYKGITYIQNGLYWVQAWDRKIGAHIWRAKIRGMDRPSLMRKEDAVNVGRGWTVDELARKNVLRHMAEDVYLRKSLPATTTRFFGIGQAVVHGMPVWRSWRTEPKNVYIGGGYNGKRSHLRLACKACSKAENATLVPHDMVIGNKVSGQDPISRKHGLPWINPHLRNEEDDWITQREGEKFDVFYS